MRLNLVTWNVLADCYTRRPAPAPVPLPQAPSDHTSWSFRSSLIRQCLREADADIYCLQEVDHFAEFYQPCLAERGYESLYLGRPSRYVGM
jgi:nocturnin